MDEELYTLQNNIYHPQLLTVMRTRTMLLRVLVPIIALLVEIRTPNGASFTVR